MYLALKRSCTGNLFINFIHTRALPSYSCELYGVHQTSPHCILNRYYKWVENPSSGPCIYRYWVIKAMSVDQVNGFFYHDINFNRFLCYHFGYMNGYHIWILALTSHCALRIILGIATIQSCRSLNENLQEFGKTDQMTDKTRICMKRNYLVTWPI